jgi:hypothetical protein
MHEAIRKAMNEITLNVILESIIEISRTLPAPALITARQKWRKLPADVHVFCVSANANLFAGAKQMLHAQ